MKRKRKGIAAALLLLGILLAFAYVKNGGPPDVTQGLPQVQAGVYKKITAEEAHRMMEESNNYILLDVRTPEEFAEAHIEGAVLLPDYEIQDKAKEQLPDQDATILVYCRSGRRSAEAARRLIDMGYANVYDFGGILDWPYDTVSGGIKKE